MQWVDLRSDTVTRPTPEMRQVMMNAEVGDDVFGEDPTINRLQEMMAELTGKEAALFVPSGTQGNQVCINTHTQPGEEIIVERRAHIINFESGAPAMLSGVQVFPIDGKRGVITAEQIERAIRPTDIHHAPTKLICLENTHNIAGGTIFPLEEIKKISELARQRQLKMHLDGARLWNASVATGISLKEYCQYFDSASLCFSKGLGAPVGSIIVGSREFIERARYYRKAYGGAMRQAGILAAAAIYAIENNFPKLAEDHRRAHLLAEAIRELPGIRLDMESVQTNILIFNVDDRRMSAPQLVEKLREKGILMLSLGPDLVRAVFHLQISDIDLERTIQAFHEILGH